MITNKIEYKPYCCSIKLEKNLNVFFERTFNSFHEELQLLRNTMYKSEQSKDIFALNERTWVGILNNAILKAFPHDEISTLQEFGVYDEDKKNHIGRADYLVCCEDKYLLFEAKQYEEKSVKNLCDENKNDLAKEQAIKYYNAELNYYNKEGKTAFIIPIYFGWMRKEGLIEKAKEYKIESDETDFCALYYEGNSGVWVYGKVYNSEEVINK
ncbi:MAG: hypothetical protein NTU43_02295, partial [Bacteroidetes bacterium]|nr:hypothetical protein [Bacteroidota bacterium]